MQSHPNLWGKPLKRLRQFFYICGHPIEHFRCAATIKSSCLADGHFTQLKYLGDHLALSLRARERREALRTHYELLPNLLKPGVNKALCRGLPVWERQIDDQPPLAIFLEPSRLAPMEGELQLRFSFKSDLSVLTFSLTPGRVFGFPEQWVLFVGGLQGKVDGRNETRQAAKMNAEISPATMLVIGVQAIARALGLSAIVAIGHDDQISMSYSPSKVVFDYARFWLEAGGKLIGRHYALPVEPVFRPLSETPRTHRPRTRRKREAKLEIGEAMERQVRRWFSAPMTRGGLLLRPANPWVRGLGPAAAAVGGSSQLDHEVVRVPTDD